MMKIFKKGNFLRAYPFSGATNLAYCAPLTVIKF